MNGMDAKRIFHSLWYLACVLHSLNLVSLKTVEQNAADRESYDRNDPDQILDGTAEDGMLQMSPNENINVALEKFIGNNLSFNDDASGMSDEKDFEMQKQPSSPIETEGQYSANKQIRVRDDVIGNMDGKNNERLMQKLQNLPTDKLKNLLTLINKHETTKLAKLEEDAVENNPSENEARNTGKLNIESQNADQSEIKSTFHRLYRDPMQVDPSVNGRGNDGMSDEKGHIMKIVNGNPRTVETVEPATSVMIHAFEGGKDEENDNYDNTNLRGISKEENQVNQQIRPLNKLSEDENVVKNEDLFAGAEEKASELAGSLNQTVSASNRMSFLHPILHRNALHKDETSVLDNRDGTQTENSLHEVHVERDNGKNTFISPISLKPILDKDDKEVHYHKMNEEKLPNSIIQEINNAMIQRIRDSGDKRASFQGTRPRYELQGSLSRDQSSIDVKSPLNREEALQLDVNKRGGKSQYAFSYDPESPIGPEMWKVLHTDWTCQGRKQSPINILSDSVINDTVSNNIVIRVEPEGRPISGILRNNGHAPTFSLTSGAIVRLIGGRLPNDYYLKQLHLHFGCDGSRGSEHKIDGQSYPLELHLVFWDKKTFDTFAQAAKSDRGLAVVAILFQRSFVPSGQVKNTPLSQMMQVVRKIPNEGDFVQISEIFDFRLEKLIPNVMNSQQADRFFTYEGSLSTPGCYESVSWFVYDTHPSVTDDQLEILRKLKSTKVNSEGTMCDNFRPIQKSFGRRIYSNIV